MHEVWWTILYEFCCEFSFLFSDKWILKIASDLTKVPPWVWWSTFLEQCISPIRQKLPGGQWRTKFGKAVGGLQRNHLREIFWWSVKACRFCRGSKIAISHWQSQSPLTRGVFESLIRQFGDQQCLRDVTSPQYADADVRQAALRCISVALDGIPTGRPIANLEFEISYRPTCTRSPAIAEGPRDAGVPVEIW